MESVLGRYRNLVILVGVLFLQMLGLAVQVKRSNDTEHTRLIRVWAVDVITPFERVLIWAQNGTGNLWHSYLYLRGVRAENRQLKDQIEQLRLEQVRLNEDAVQAHRLQALLAFKEQYISRTVAAQVIGSSGSDSSRMLYIDKGEDQGLKRDMAVITADGIVGKVLQVFPSVSQVLLINDQSSGVGTILEKSRLQGFLKGTATGEVVLEGVMSDEQVATGERVLTSGGDQIFPKGLPVGTVTNVGTGKDLFLNIQIKPAVNLGKLEEVLVVVERQERQAQTADVGRVRAADILAQRLPSVPDKPASVTNSPTTVPAGTAPKAASPKPAPAGGEAVAKQPVKSPSGSVVAGSKAASPAATQPKPSTAEPDPVKADPPKVDPANVGPANVGPAKVNPAKVDPATTESQDSPH
jgi:rod shape-determining protein MreC